MPIVTIQASGMSQEQKRRIGEQVLNVFHAEGIPASTVILLFESQRQDVLLEGGLFLEGEAPLPAPPAAMQELRPQPAAAAPTHESQPAPAADYRSKARRNRAELSALKAKLVSILQDRGHLTSFDAQEALDLKDCDWAPATLRRFFAELEAEGVIVKQGQKRGTRYVWRNPRATSESLPRLVKRGEENPDQELAGGAMEL